MIKPNNRLRLIPSWVRPWRSARRLTLLAGVAVLAAASCRSAPRGVAPIDTSDDYATAIETAHGIHAWWGWRALAADITVRFGGETALAGKLLMETKTARCRIDLADGPTLIFDGANAWVQPPSSDFQGARFHLLTWSYFIGVPMKLRDPGTVLVPMGLRRLRGKTLSAARLTFEPGVGDTPDDWYITYADPGTNRLAALAYIVTYGKDAAEAETEPHAISFGGFETIDGVTVSTRWRFWDWSEEAGIHGPQLGDASLANVQFVEPEPDAFKPGENARREDLPGGGG